MGLGKTLSCHPRLIRLREWLCGRIYGHCGSYLLQDLEIGRYCLRCGRVRRPEDHW